MVFDWFDLFLGYWYFDGVCVDVGDGGLYFF